MGPLGARAIALFRELNALERARRAAPARDEQALGAQACAARETPTRVQLKYSFIQGDGYGA